MKRPLQTIESPFCITPAKHGHWKETGVSMMALSLDSGMLPSAFISTSPRNYHFLANICDRHGYWVRIHHTRCRLDCVLIRNSPYKFQAPWHVFEFSFHILEIESNLVIVSMAWMTREDPRRFTRMPNEPDMETLTYWVTRLKLLIRSDICQLPMYHICRPYQHPSYCRVWGFRCRGKSSWFFLNNCGDHEVSYIH